jgi:hypothetical protein
MKTLLLSLFLSAMLLSAADVAGKWSGSLAVKNRDGESRNVPAFLVIKQDGDKLTGTVGPTEQRQDGVFTGQVDKNQLSFAIEQGGHVITFKLEVGGESLKGEMRRVNSDRPADVGLVSLKRAKD